MACQHGAPPRGGRAGGGAGTHVPVTRGTQGGGQPAVPSASTPTVADPLTDPHRIAAARRLLDEVAGPAAFDRLSALAARLVGACHAKVTLFTHQDKVVGGYGLPPGVI